MKEENKKPSFIDYMKENGTYGIYCGFDDFEPALEDFAEWDDKKNDFVGIGNKGIYRDIERCYYTWEKLIEDYSNFDSDFTILDMWGEIKYTTVQDGLNEHMEEWLEDNPEYVANEGDDEYEKLSKKNKRYEETLNYLNDNSNIYRIGTDGLTVKRY